MGALSHWRVLHTARTVPASHAIRPHLLRGSTAFFLTAGAGAAAAAAAVRGGGAAGGGGREGAAATITIEEAAPARVYAPGAAES